MAMETAYLKAHMGDCLAQCLCEVAEKRPADPIEYISQWLYKYEENQRNLREKQAELERIVREKEEYEQEKKMQQEMRQEAARIRAIEERKRKEEELLKQQELSTATKLATVMEKSEELTTEKTEESTTEKIELTLSEDKPAADEVPEEQTETIVGSQDGGGGEDLTLSQGEENVEEDSEEPPAE